MTVRIRALIACGIVAIASGAHAQTSEAFHFASDESRHARVDDRGGLGTGYSFSIGYDPDDGNSEDFCPHCRLTVLTSDPGLDLAELERVGLTRSDLVDAAGTLSALQGIAAQDPSGLAAELAPEASGEDLEALVAEITRIQEEIVVVIGALEALATIADGGLDPSSSIDALIDALSLRMDTAFRADFSNPNDPREHNSGVAVYGVPELSGALAASGVPASVVDAVESALSTIPGASGTLELSGDDDDVLAPASCHGRDTDLTIRQRTYVVNGVSAYLLVYTIVNDTSRVFPHVQAAMMADFDVPPTAYDTATDFDPSAQMVMVYDEIPYVEPEQHYWFGLAPARAGPPTPGQFGFASWNLDRNFTLAQFGSSTTQQNRVRFFLFDPALTGDHDDATGKSEKQGAVSMLLAGPLLPGDARSVAFCYAAGEGGSSGAARAELTATMAACRAIYTAVTPMCGDGVLQYPEECDEPTASCNGSCQRVSCGDGRVDAPEECDDANITPGDGCHDCRLEGCGNGRLDAGEECDDGNASSADACLNDCTSARCGDGVVRMGCDGADCGCAGFEHCLSGRFTLEDVPSGSAFEPLAGVPIDYRVGFDVAATDADVLSAERGIRVTTGPVNVEMSGHPLATEIAASLDGGTWVLDLRAMPLRGSLAFDTSLLRGTGGGTRYGLELQSAGEVPFSTDGDGRPALSTLRFVTGTAFLEAVVLFDRADGPARGAIGSVPAGSGGEVCDDGNASDFDACTSACVPAVCGDGIVQASEGEECDGGASPPSWCVDCLRTGDTCGDGVVDDAFDEECDDGNTIDGDDCSASCRTERCGDGVMQAAEECDDGANGDGDGCTDACRLERCGDGIQQASEACDTGPSVGDGAACTATCRDAICGDGLVHDGAEECDDGNAIDGDGCGASCALERCGDGRPGPGEDATTATRRRATAAIRRAASSAAATAGPVPTSSATTGTSATGMAATRSVASRTSPRAATRASVEASSAMTARAIRGTAATPIASSRISRRAGTARGDLARAATTATRSGETAARGSAPSSAAATACTRAGRRATTATSAMETDATRRATSSRPTAATGRSRSASSATAGPTATETAGPRGPWISPRPAATGSSTTARSATTAAARTATAATRRASSRRACAATPGSSGGRPATKGTRSTATDAARRASSRSAPCPRPTRSRCPRRSRPAATPRRRAHRRRRSRSGSSPRSRWRTAGGAGDAADSTQLKDGRQIDWVQLDPDPDAESEESEKRWESG